MKHNFDGSYFASFDEKIVKLPSEFTQTNWTQGL